MSAEVAAEPLSVNERIAQVNSRVSQVVRTLMAARNVTIKQLAEQTSLDEDTLGRRLRGVGKHGWLAAELDVIAEALDADVSLFYEAVPINWFRRKREGLQPSGGKVAAQVVRTLQLVPPPRHVTLRPHSPRPLLRALPSADTCSG